MANLDRPVTLVKGPPNLEWDRLIWILYDREYQLAEAWLWDVDAYRARLATLPRLRPVDLRLGTRLYPVPTEAALPPARAPAPHMDPSPAMRWVAEAHPGLDVAGVGVAHLA